MNDKSPVSASQTRAPASQRSRTAEMLKAAKELGKDIAVTIDGKPLEVPLGTTILETAAQTRHPHPHALLPRRPLPSGRVSGLRGGNRGPADLASSVQLPDLGADYG